MVREALDPRRASRALTREGVLRVASGGLLVAGAVALAALLVWLGWWIGQSAAAAGRPHHEVVIRQCLYYGGAFIAVWIASIAALRRVGALHREVARLLRWSLEILEPVFAPVRGEQIRPGSAPTLARFRWVSGEIGGRRATAIAYGGAAISQALGVKSHAHALFSRWRPKHPRGLTRLTPEVLPEGWPDFEVWTAHPEWTVSLLAKPEALRLILSLTRRGPWSDWRLSFAPGQLGVGGFIWLGEQTPAATQGLVARWDDLEALAEILERDPPPGPAAPEQPMVSSRHIQWMIRIYSWGWRAIELMLKATLALLYIPPVVAGLGMVGGVLALLFYKGG